jgi:hypothetical protein
VEIATFLHSRYTGYMPYIGALRVAFRDSAFCRFSIRASVCFHKLFFFHWPSGLDLGPSTLRRNVQLLRGWKKLTSALTGV